MIEENINNVTAISSSVLIEEIGHFIDFQLNPTDTLGDEGAIFAAIVMGADVSESVLGLLKAEDDRRTIKVNGREIQVEFQRLATLGSFPGSLSRFLVFLENILPRYYRVRG